ncbi:hypothetical protein BGX31_002247, partial [Mortierella sp. GBA43]
MPSLSCQTLGSPETPMTKLMRKQWEEYCPGILAVKAMAKALGLTGIRHPIGMTAYQVSKGTCNGAFPEVVHRCKYDT